MSFNVDPTLTYVGRRLIVPIGNRCIQLIVRSEFHNTELELLMTIGNKGVISAPDVKRSLNLDQSHQDNHSIDRPTGISSPPNNACGINNSGIMQEFGDER